MTIDLFTLVVCAVLLVAATLTPLLNPFFRLRKKHFLSGEKSGDAPMPPVSVVITAHNDAYALERHLPDFLNQDYPSGYEVIVVAEKGDSDTEDVLKRFASNERLYATFIPQSSRYMSRKKLAITIGVKAAKNQWIMLTEPCCKPVGDQWLKSMASACSEDKNMVIGYSNFGDDAKAWQRFDRLHADYYLMRHTLCATAYRANSFNLMFRKDEFIKGYGYQGNLEHIRGEYDFLVNKYARKHSAALVTTPTAWLCEDAPDKKTWRNEKLFYVDTRKHLRRGFFHRLLFNIDTIALHLNYLLIIAATIYASLTSSWIILAAAIISLILTITLRITFARKAFRLFNVNISSWLIIPLEIGVVWRNLFYMTGYKFADKYDFTTHKL